jgi:hypothetical protein
MNTKTEWEDWLLRWSRSRKCGVAGWVALLLLLPVTMQGGGVVTDCTEANLRAALADGGKVTFACDGAIVLESTITITNDTTLDGSDHEVTLNGNNAVRIFHVQTNVTLSLANIKLAQGWSTNGGGIYNEGGHNTMTGVALVANVAANSMGEACGGAVFNASGTVNATNCVFAQNAASGGPGRGASYVAPVAVPAEPGHNGSGGAVHNTGVFNASQCSFAQNRVDGGPGGPGLCLAPDIIWPYPDHPSYVLGGGGGGAAAGGAICNLQTLLLERSLIASNLAFAGLGGAGAAGDGYPGYPCYPSTSGSAGGSGGNAGGAALFNNGPAALLNCTLAWNSAGRGAGNHGGVGVGFYCNGYGQTVGGQGGNGGAGMGAIFNQGPALNLISCSVARNSGNGARGGTSGASGYWLVYPPGGPPQYIIYPAPPDGLNGDSVGGVGRSGNLINTLFASNAPVNCVGTIADLGHNLSSDATGDFTNVGSLKSTDPKLGSLAKNGGPILTMALLPGSPAIDGGDDASAPATDQRGLPRVGAAADIGAFEFGSPALLQISRSSENVFEIFVLGVKNQSCRLLKSTTLSDWQCVATNQFGADGTTSFQDNHGPGDTHKFYRVALP